MDALDEQNAPATQAAFSFAVLFVVYGIAMVYNRTGLHAHWYVYMAIGLIDAVAFYATTYGMYFTSVTSMGVLTSSGVISSIPLAHCVLKARFRPLHYVGVVLAMAGIILLVLADKSSDSSGDHVVVGDVLILLGNFLYTLSAIVIEKVLKTSIPFHEVLCMLSAYACVASVAVFFAIGEYKYFVPLFTKIGLLRSVAIVTKVGIYSLLPPILAWSGTTVMQLSFLSTSIWAVPLRLVFFGGFGSEWWIFMMAAVVTAVGILLYIIGGNVYTTSAGEHHDLVCSDALDQCREHEPYLPLQQAPIL